MAAADGEELTRLPDTPGCKVFEPTKKPATSEATSVTPVTMPGRPLRIDQMVRKKFPSPWNHLFFSCFSCFCFIVPPSALLVHRRSGETGNVFGPFRIGSFLLPDSTIGGSSAAKNPPGACCHYDQRVREEPVITDADSYGEQQDQPW